MSKKPEPQPTPTPPSQINLLLWWFSTSIPELIKDCKSDANRSRIIGAGVLFTFLYASIAWIYFWSINVTTPWLYVPLGLFMGFGILTIDRMLISSIKAGKINIVPTIFRVLLAMALGTFIAQPVILWMFNEDLQGEIKILNDLKIEEKNQSLLAIKASQSTALQADKTAIEQSLDAKYTDVQEARKSYQEEIDGTGGSKRYGIKTVGKEKGRILATQEQEYATLKADTQPRLDSLSSQLAQIEKTYLTEISTFRNEYANTGFLIHVEALQSLLKKDATGALRERYYLLLIILVLFELVPIISKIFLPTGSYDKKVALLEAIEEREFASDFEKRISLHESYNDGSKKQDLKMMAEFFKRSDPAKGQKMEELIAQWQAQNGDSERNLWEDVKKKVMS